VKVTREKIENCQAYLTVEMEPTEMAESMEDGYRHLVQRANIPGFRKGKAPRAVVERQLGKERMLEEAIEHLLPRAYEQAVKEQELKPYAQPEIEIVQTEPVIFKAVVPLPPTVELGDYQGIRLTQEPVTVTDENVNNVLENLRHQNAVWEPVARPLAHNDMAVLDINSTVEEKPFLQRVGAQYQLEKDSVLPLPGFVEQLLGMSKGEEKEFKLKLPDDYATAELAGKEVSFKVKILEVKEEKLPALDDAFAQQISSEYQTLDVLRGKVAESLKQSAEEQSRINFEQLLIKAAVEKAVANFPPVLVEMELNRLLNEQARQLQMSGISIEVYLQNIKKTEAELREELRPAAARNITGSLVLDKIAEVEKVEVSDTDVNAEIERIVGGTVENKKEEVRQLLATPQNRDSLIRSLLTRKTMDRLVTIARGPEEKKTEVKEAKKNE